MKTLLKALSVVLLTTILSCFKLENKPSEKETLLVAVYENTDLNKINETFKIYKDSTYLFTQNTIEPNHSKLEKFEGKVQIKNDTIQFTPFGFSFNNAKTAVLKNGFVEFIDSDDYPYRMKIEKTSLFVKNNIDFNRFKNYAVFTFYKKYNRITEENNNSNYDLNNNDLKKIEAILSSQIKKNKNLNNYSSYLKQIVAERNEKNEVIVFAHLFCKDQHTLSNYQYYEISMMDGGKCNIRISLNLSTGKINFINIAGLA